jgi:hypothetical protein
MANKKSIAANQSINESVVELRDITGTRTGNKNALDVALLLQNIAVTLPDGYELLMTSNSDSVPENTEEVVFEYIVDAGKLFAPALIEFSGNNFAEFTLLINNSVIHRKRTWWTNFNGDFNLAVNGVGKYYPAGTKIEVKANNYRPQEGDFDVMLLGILKTI